MQNVNKQNTNRNIEAYSKSNRFAGIRNDFWSICCSYSLFYFRWPTELRRALCTLMNNIHNTVEYVMRCKVGEKVYFFGNSAWFKTHNVSMLLIHKTTFSVGIWFQLVCVHLSFRNSIHIRISTANNRSNTCSMAVLFVGFCKKRCNNIVYYADRSTTEILSIY